MSSPDNNPSIYDLGEITYSSSTLDILTITSQGNLPAVEPKFTTDMYGVPVEASVAQREIESRSKFEQPTIWVHKYPHWEAKPKKELAPVVVVDFTADNPQDEVREELQVA